jgi:hypothetical protein
MVAYMNAGFDVTALRVQWARIAIATVSLFVFTASAASVPSDDRLVGLARLWAVVEFFHPRTTDPSFDWDGAVTAGMHRVTQANNAAEMRSALQSLLDKLDDPVTKVLSTSDLNLISNGIQISTGRVANPVAGATMSPSGVLLITANDGTTFQAFNQQLDAVRKAEAIVFDLRHSLPGTFDQSLLARALASHSIVAPGQRRRVYHGDRLSSAAFLIDGGGRFDSFAGTHDKRVVFLLGPNTEPPDAALALQANGNGWIVVEGSPNVASTVETWRIKFPFDVEVQVRTSELFNRDGTTGSNLT